MYIMSVAKDNKGEERFLPEDENKWVLEN